MKFKIHMFNCLFLFLALFLLSSCKGKDSQKEIIAKNSTKTTNSKTINYDPNKVNKSLISNDEVTDFAWKIYNILTGISDGGSTEDIYKQIRTNFFVKLKDDDNFFPWFEDMLFNRMNFVHIKKLDEDVVCTKTVNNKSYFLVQLTVLGDYKYEFTSNDVVEEKSGLTTMAVYMMIATKEDGSLGYYNMLSFTKAPHEMDQEINMFNGLVDAQDEQIYLKSDINSDNQKELSLNEQYMLNNPKTVTVFAIDKDDNILRANGVYVHQYLILTPLNMKNCVNAWVYTSDKELIDIVGIVDSSSELGLSLIKLQHDLPYEVYPMEMGKLDELSDNDIVYILDSCNSIEDNLKKGAVTNFWMYKDVQYGQTTVPINSEDNGAALLDIYGNLIGVVSDNVPGENSFIQSIEYSNDVFADFYNQKGKNVPVKTTFNYQNANQTIEDLYKFYDYHMLYSNKILPCKFSYNKYKIDNSISIVTDSINQRNKFISGIYEKADDEERNNKDIYFSEEIDPNEESELLALKQEFIVENQNDNQSVSHYVQYDNIEILGISEDEITPYVLVSYDLSIYDKKQSPDSPIKKNCGMELLKYSPDLDIYQLVSTVR